MNKNGFTLTELLATILIMSIIAIISFVVYNSQIDKSRTQLYKSHESSLKDSAQTFILNCIAKNKCDNGKTVDYYENYANGISIKDLVDNNYINEIKDPASKSNCSGSVYIGNSSDTNRENNTEYDYKVCLVCSKYESSACSSFTPVSTSVSASGSTLTVSPNTLLAKGGKVSFKVTGYTDHLEFIPSATCTRSESDRFAATCVTDEDQTSDFTIKTIHKLNKHESTIDVIVDNEAPTISYTITSTGVGESGWSKTKTLNFTVSDNYNGSINTLKYSMNNGSSWSNIAMGDIKTFTYDKATTVKMKVKDKLGNVRSKTISIKNVSNTSPVITVSNMPTSKVKSQAITISGLTTASASTSNSYLLFLSESTAPTSIINSKSYVLDTAVEIGNGLNGTYYLYVRQLKDKAYNLSTSDEMVTIDGLNYHKFGPVQFDNTGSN